MNIKRGMAEAGNLNGRRGDGSCVITAVLKACICADNVEYFLAINEKLVTDFAGKAFVYGPGHGTGGRGI